MELDERGETPRWYPLEGVLEYFGQAGLRAIDVEREIEALEHSWTRVVGLFAEWQSSRPLLDSFFEERFKRKVLGWTTDRRLKTED